RGRMRESAIRAALGAGRARLVRLALTESVLLALAGGLIGTLAAYWGVRGIVHLPVDVPRLDEVQLDARVLAFSLALSWFSGVLFGMLPAWRLTGADPADTLKAGSHTTTENRRGAAL